MKESVFLFDELYEDDLVEFIDKSNLKKKMTLPASKDSKKKVDVNFLVTVEIIIDFQYAN